MGKKVRRPARRRGKWRGVVPGIVVLATIGGVYWWFSEARDVPGGTPRLALDRTEADLGYLPFDSPARVVFMLTNSGSGTLRLTDVPWVKVLRGC